VRLQALQWQASVQLKSWIKSRSWLLWNEDGVDDRSKADSSARKINSNTTSENDSPSTTQPGVINSIFGEIVVAGTGTGTGTGTCTGTGTGLALKSIVVPILY